MRKSKPKKRIVLPDPVFNESMVTKFVNHLMYDGKKSTAFDIFYSSLETVKNKLPNEEKSPLEVWKKALENITPLVEESISMKNLILYSRKRGGRSMADKLAAEIVDAFNNQGGAFKRKEDMHRMAEANRAFAHFRF